MQILFAVEHTIFKIEDYTDNYHQLLKFIETNFSAKNIKENMLYIPLSLENNHKRKFLIKWLYSYYQKSHPTPDSQIKRELSKRINKPIHLHFLPKENQLITITATFYDNGICQLQLDGRNKKCELFLLQYFSGFVRFKSMTFNLYEVKIESHKQKNLLRKFFQKDIFKEHNILLQYNAKALDLFLEIKKESDPIERACKILKVTKEDSLKDIKRHYKQLAKKYHPDLCRLEDEESTKKFQILSDAFNIIKKYKSVA